MGSPKALLPLHHETFLDRLIGLCAQECARSSWSWGTNPNASAAHSRRPAEFVVNEDYPLGQITSMQCGLRAVPAACPGVLSRW